MDDQIFGDSPAFIQGRRMNHLYLFVILAFNLALAASARFEVAVSRKGNAPISILQAQASQFRPALQ